jgi:hypothetical protein
MSFIRKVRKKLSPPIPQLETKKYVLKEKGQHTIEYVILLTLIMAGIMIMGPYVIRSWNAQVKGWEDSVVDSLQDPLIGAPAGSINISGCDDQLVWFDLGCNLGALDECNPANSVNCSPIEMLQWKEYLKDRCQCPSEKKISVGNYLRCVEHALCCTAWSPSGAAIQPNDCGSPTCPYGQVRQTRACGAGGLPTSQCVSDPACVFSCLGAPGPSTPPAYGTCDPPYPAYVGLLDDTPYTYVDPGLCDGTKCQVQCSPSYISYGGASCGCPSGQLPTGPGQTCICASGFVEQCSSGPHSGDSSYCNPCTIGPNAGDPAYCQD